MSCLAIKSLRQMQLSRPRSFGQRERHVDRALRHFICSLADAHRAHALGRSGLYCHQYVRKCNTQTISTFHRLHFHSSSTHAAPVFENIADPGQPPPEPPPQPLSDEIQHHPLDRKHAGTFRTGGAKLASFRKARLLDTHETPWLESKFDAMLMPHPTVPPQLSLHDWRNRAVSRKSLHRNARVSSSTKSSPVRPRIQRAKVLEPNVEVGDPIYERIERYKERFLPLLEAEKAEAQALLKSRLQSWPALKLELAGYLIQDLRAFWLDATIFGKPVASFSLGVGQELPNHVFRVGDDAYISRNGPLVQDEKVYIGQVTSVSPTSLAITFDAAEELDGYWRLDLGCSDTAFRRMREAVNSFLYEPEHQARSLTDGIALRGTYLRDVLLPRDGIGHDSGSKVHSAQELSLGPMASKLFLEDMRLRSWCQRHSRPDPIKVPGDPELSNLNETQIRAIAMMIMKRVSLVQGPPGTGKTKTIIEAIRLLKAHFEVPQPILVCTYTNAAVDHLVEGLAALPTPISDTLHKEALKLKPLRIGFGSSSMNPLYPYNFLTKVDSHPMKGELDKLQHRIDKLQDVLNAARAKLTLVNRELKPENNSHSENVKKKKLQEDIQKLSNEKLVKQSIYYSLYRQITFDICQDSDVICTTCIASACFALSVLDFPVVFIDEASMSTEPASLIPIMKGSQHLALIGDHKQLPPVIKSEKAKEGGLAISLFERLMTGRNIPSIMLDIQYRMHPEISSFPSAEFYDFNLIDGTVDSLGNVEISRLPPNSSLLKPDATGKRPSVIFLSHEMPECTRNRSRANDGEALLVVGIIEDLLLNNPRMTGGEIGVIAPYVAQMNTLRDLLWTDEGIREQFKLSLGSDRALETSKIEIKTVDGFEGREKEVVIFSTTRNNDAGHIGFLADRRRLNVGLTRAKRALFVLGNAKTLTATKLPAEWTEDVERDMRLPVLDESAWKKYLRWLEEQRLVLVLRGPDLRKAMGKRATVQKR